MRDRSRFGPHRLMLRPARQPRSAARAHRACAVARGRAALDPRRLRQLGRDRDLRASRRASCASRARCTSSATPSTGRFSSSTRTPATYPFVYSSEDRTDLGRLLERHSPTRTASSTTGPQSFVTGEADGHARSSCRASTPAIKAHFAYRPATRKGTQTPAETLERRSGTCRDYAYPDDRGRAQPRLRRPLRHRLPLRPEARRRPATTAPPAPARPMPGARSTCPAPAGSSTIRPTPSSAATRADPRRVTRDPVAGLADLRQL